MGFFGGGDSTTSAEDNRQAGADQAIVQRQGGSVGTGASSIGTAAGSNIAQAGATQLQYSSQATNGGVLLQGNSHLTVSSDPQVIRDALAAVTDSTGRFTGTLADLFRLQNQQADNQHDNVSQLISGQAESQQSFLSQIASLAKNVQTGGATDVNKNMLYAVLGLLAVVAVIFWSRK